MGCSGIWQGRLVQWRCAEPRVLFANVTRGTVRRQASQRGQGMRTSVAHQAALVGATVFHEAADHHLPIPCRPEHQPHPMLPRVRAQVVVQRDARRRFLLHSHHLPDLAPRSPTLTRFATLPTCRFRKNVAHPVRGTPTSAAQSGSARAPRRAIQQSVGWSTQRRGLTGWLAVRSSGRSWKRIFSIWQLSQKWPNSGNML